jgi:large subunit ribosomal protein L35
LAGVGLLREKFNLKHKGKPTMPKLKTRKCAAKRLKMTGTGKFRHNKAGASHILTKKSPKRKRRLHGDGEVSKAESRRIKAALPYGL